MIDNDGEKLGLKSIDEALKFAQEKQLDLVQVSSPDSEQVVCKIMDYGKHIFEEKNASSSKGKSKRTTVKEIKFRPSTDIGDFNIKLKKLKALLIVEIGLK